MSYLFLQCPSLGHAKCCFHQSHYCLFMQFSRRVLPLQQVLHVTGQHSSTMHPSPSTDWLLLPQVPPADNYFAALNSAVFTDGSFVYIPKGVKCPMELSTYFRINAEETGQVHMIISVQFMSNLHSLSHIQCHIYTVFSNNRSLD